MTNLTVRTAETLTTEVKKEKVANRIKYFFDRFDCPTTTVNVIGTYTFVTFHETSIDKLTLLIFRNTKQLHAIKYKMNGYDKKTVIAKDSSWSLYLGYARDEAKKAEQYKAYNVKNDCEVGDIFYSSWGYSMTFVDYYQVVGFKGAKTLIVKQICSNIVDGDHFTGQSVAVKDSFASDDLYQLRMGKSMYFSGKLRGNNSHTVYAWDGKPKYFNTLD